MFQIWYDIYDVSNLIRLDKEHDQWDQSHVHDIKYVCQIIYWCNSIWNRISDLNSPVLRLIRSSDYLVIKGRRDSSSSLAHLMDSLMTCRDVIVIQFHEEEERIDFYKLF